MDVKQEINPKTSIFTLPQTFFTAALSQEWEQSAILNQENMSVDSKIEKKRLLNHFLKA